MRAIGKDVSHHNGTVRFSGEDFAIIRTQNGTTEDTEYKNNLAEIQKYERRGVYMYYRTNHQEHPFADQADMFLSLSSGKGMKMRGIDYEISDYDDNVINRETAIEFYGFCLYVLQQRPNTRVMIYTSIYTWRDVLLPLQGEETEYGVVDWMQFGIWLPRYGWADPGDPRILEIAGVQVLPRYDILQYTKTGDGSEHGVDSTYVDLNVFNGTPEDMDKWLGITEEPVDCCEELTKEVGEITNYIGELGQSLVRQQLRIAMNEKQLDLLQQGQLELTEDVIAVEEKVSRLPELEGAILELDVKLEKLKGRISRLEVKTTEDLVGKWGVYERLENLEDKIAGLDGGHNHPKFFRWLNWLR